MLGSALVGTAEAEIDYVNSQACNITYVNARTDIDVEYNSKNKEFGRDGSESVTLSDTFEVTVAYTRTATDSVSVAEQIVVAMQFNLAISDSLSSSDSLAWTFGKNVTESITTSDTPGIGKIHKVNESDNVTAGDTPGIGQIYHVDPTDNVSVSDSVLTYHDGMLNTNMLNTRLISAGDLEVTGDNVDIS